MRRIDAPAYLCALSAFLGLLGAFCGVIVGYMFFQIDIPTYMQIVGAASGGALAVGNVAIWLAARGCRGGR